MIPLLKAQHDLENAIITAGPLPGGIIPPAVAAEVAPVIAAYQREWARHHLGSRAHRFLYLLGILGNLYPPEPLRLWVDFEIENALLEHGFESEWLDGQGCERRSRHGGIEAFATVTWTGAAPWRPPAVANHRDEEGAP